MKRIKWNFLIVCFFCLYSCADLTELNENPTKATSISSHLLIPTIQLTHSQYLQSTLRYMIFPGAFVNHWIGDLFTSVRRSGIRRLEYAGIWRQM